MSPSADQRRVAARPGRSELREKASRFLAFAFPAATAAEASDLLAGLKRRYHEASHVAFTWRIGTGPALSRRSSDAGEPPGSAGKPIAAAIESAGVGDILVAVVRYFGGTKLGAGGLARAYRAAAAEAIRAAGEKLCYETRGVRVNCPYAKVGALRRLLDPPRVTLVEERFDQSAAIRLEVLRSRLPKLLAQLDQARFSYELDPDS